MNGFGPWQQQQLCAHADVFLLLQILWGIQGRDFAVKL
jgi:hypothetical protein